MKYVISPKNTTSGFTSALWRLWVLWSEMMKPSGHEHDRLRDLPAHQKMPVQISMLLLPMFMLSKMGYLARVTPPTLFLPHARTFDAKAVETAKRRLGLPAEVAHQSPYA